MPNIEIGEYVKLDYGKIGKIIAVEKGSIMLDIASNRWVGMCCIVKHSKNIIDIIEIGDYVNGLIIIGKYFDENNKICLILDTTDKVRIRCYEQDIKLIVTKEQFKQVQYKVGD